MTGSSPMKLVDVILGMRGDRVVDVEVDHTMRLTTDRGDQVVVENDFSLVSAGKARSCSLGLDSWCAEQLLNFARHTITSLHVEHDGSLVVEFGHQGTLSVSPCPDFEAWNVTGVTGWKVVCLPGGELAVWS